MPSTTPPLFLNTPGFIRLRVSQTRTVNIRNHVIGAPPIIFFKGSPALDWVTVKGNGVLEIDPPDDIDIGRHEMQVQAISVYGVSYRTYIILVARAIRPRWDWGRGVTEYISENLMEHWDLEPEVEGDGTITLSKRSGPDWVQLNGFILTYLPPEIITGEYEDFAVGIRATSEWGTRDTTITLRVHNDGQTSLYFELPAAREVIAEGGDFEFDTSDYVQHNVGTVTYHKERGSDWLEIAEQTGVVTGTAPLVDADERHFILVEVRDSQSFRRDSLLITVTNEVLPATPPPATLQWGRIPPQRIDEQTPFAFSVRSYFTGTTTAVFSKQSGPAWVSVSNTGSVMNTSGQTAPDVTADADYTIGIRATVGTETYDTTFTLTVGVVAGGDPTSNAPPMISLPIPDVAVDALTYFEFSVGSHVTGGTSGGAIVIQMLTGPSWLSIGGTGICSGTPKAVPSRTVYPVTFQAVSVYGIDTNGAFNLIVRNVQIATEPPTWQQVPPLYANAFSWFNRNIRRYVSGSGLITLTKTAGPDWISISPNGQSLRGTTPRGRQQVEVVVVVTARSAYGTAAQSILFVVRGSVTQETALTFTPPRTLASNERTTVTRDLSAYIGGATGTVTYQVNHAPAGVSVAGSILTLTAGEVENTVHHAVFLRASDGLGGVTAVLTWTIRNTSGGGVLPETLPVQQPVLASTSAMNTEPLFARVAEIHYALYTFRTRSRMDVARQTTEPTADRGTWTKFPDADIVVYGSISRSLDTVRVGEYRVGTAKITLKNVDNRYSPKNPNNFFYEQYGDAEAYGMPVYIEAGYELTDGSIRVERIFEGIVLDITHDVNDLTVTLQLSDDAQYLRRELMTDFGLAKRMIVGLEYDAETEQGYTPLFGGFTPVSVGSVVPRYPPDLTVAGPDAVFQSEGQLSPKRIQVDETAVRSETLNPQEITRYQLEMKTPYRYKRFDTLVHEIATAANIDADKQKVVLPNIYPEQPTFQTAGRPGYEIAHDYEQLRSGALTEFRWNGFVTDMHYDSRPDHDVFYFLLSAPQHEPAPLESADAEPSDKEIADDYLRLDANFGGVLDTYQASQTVQDAFGTTVAMQPRLLAYDRRQDTWRVIASRLQAAEWWKMTPNADYSKWYVLGTAGVNVARFLSTEFGAQAELIGQYPMEGTYDAYASGDSTTSVFIEEIEAVNGNVKAFLDGDSAYPPQLAHFYHVGYGVISVGPNNEVEILNQAMLRSNYFRDGIKPDSRRPLHWHGGQLYYGFVRNTATQQDFGVARTANGATITTAFPPVQVDSNNNHMGFTFDIKDDKLDFAFTVLDGVNTTFKVIQTSLRSATAAPVIADFTATRLVEDERYDEVITVRGNPVPRVTSAVTTGSLPTGMALDGARLSGIPTAVPANGLTFSVTYTATNSEGTAPPKVVAFTVTAA